MLGGGATLIFSSSDDIDKATITNSAPSGTGWTATATTTAKISNGETLTVTTHALCGS